MLKRFIDKFKVLDNGCFQWLGAIDRDGYGKFQLDGKCIFAHRYAFEVYYNHISNTLVIDHTCRFRACVNPLHMEEVTVLENTRRGSNFQRDKTHCNNGHEFTIENTYICPRNNRNCRICRRDSDKRRRLKHVTA
jgi:hypothetical protein